MQTFFLIALFVFGLLFGSFASVIIYRIKSGEGGILTGRSHCGSCNKILQTIDLIPLFSWIINVGKCRMCKTKIAKIYPLLELSTAFLFMCVGYFVINTELLFVGEFGEILTLFFWLMISFISIIYIFYDILFLEISERVLATGVGIAVIGIIIQSYSQIQIFGSLPQGIHGDLLALNHSVGLLIVTIIALYVIILKNLSTMWDVIILFLLGGLFYIFNVFFTHNFSLTDFPAISASIGALSFFIFFFLQIVISDGKWMGGGDLRIAIFVGLILGTILAFPGMMLTYLSGSIIGIFFLIYQKITYSSALKKGLLSGDEKINHQIPFGPFIAIGFFIAIFLQDTVLEFMRKWLYL